MRDRPRFALNHMVAPHADIEAFFALAAGLGDRRRRDPQRPCRAWRSPTAPTPRRSERAAEKHGVRILSINALQRFNDWTCGARRPKPQRSPTMRARAARRRWCFARSTTGTFGRGERARLDGLRRALSELAADPRATGHHRPGRAARLRGICRCAEARGGRGDRRGRRSQDVPARRTTLSITRLPARRRSSPTRPASFTSPAWRIRSAAVRRRCAMRIACSSGRATASATSSQMRR